MLQEDALKRDKYMILRRAITGRTVNRNPYTIKDLQELCNEIEGANTELAELHKKWIGY